MVGIPEFKWLDRYRELIGRKSFISSGSVVFILHLFPWMGIGLKEIELCLVILMQMAGHGIILMKEVSVELKS